MLLAIAAEKFGCRPSEMIRLRDPVVALDLDLAAAARLLERESEAANEWIDGEIEPQRAMEICW